MRFAAAAVLLLLGGCLTQAPSIPSNEVQVPALPANFTAVYEDAAGHEMRLQGHTNRSLDWHGHLAEVLLVTIDWPEDSVFASSAGSTYGFDVCGWPSWQAKITKNEAKLDDRLEIARLAGMVPFPGWVLEQGMAIPPANPWYSSVTTLRYEVAPVPSSWGEGAGTWKLVGYEGDTSAGACRHASSATPVAYTVDGPESVPSAADWTLRDVVAYVRGPLGPSGFQDWAAKNPTNWLSAFAPGLPTLSSIPDPLRQTDWWLQFSAAGSSGVEVRCEADALDGLTPVHLRPIRCSKEDGQPSDADSKFVSVFPGLSGPAATLAELGLPPTGVAGQNGEGTVEGSVEAWVRETSSLDGFSFAKYWIVLGPTGGMTFASLPADAPLI